MIRVKQQFFLKPLETWNQRDECKYRVIIKFLKILNFFYTQMYFNRVKRYE